MSNLKRLLIAILIIFSLFTVITSASAADLTVNKNVTQKNINDWMKNATKGDKLNFNTSTYTLNSTLNVTKPILITSKTKTKIIFKKNKPMFQVKTTGVTFKKLKLDYYGYKSVAINATLKSANLNVDTTDINIRNKSSIAILTNGTTNLQYSKITLYKNYNYGVVAGRIKGNIKNNKFTLKGKYSYGVIVGKIDTTIKNNNFLLKGKYNYGIFSNIWTGNSINNKFYIYNNPTLGILITNKWTGTVTKNTFEGNKYSKGACGIFVNKTFKGSIKNSNAYLPKANSFGIMVYKWNGKLYNSKINVKGKGSVGIYIAKGSLLITHNSKVTSKNYYALAKYTASIKNSKSTIKSKKGFPNILKVS
ncbi:hypothetical protein [Methanobrevibacter filiformis]|uniref:Right handed beta helix domain-containing protein n=1 Tax=Methanobrevibacter filiformis TaxID=55758 RepID=A0A166CCY7_9EURY|nr:hypothetical protein [Methanobrevibacter filiformis]KZX14379.1 hypothetical protein MBFIL_08960 [Methanobrevibacter filiformis]